MTIALFPDYGTRDVLADTVEAELRHVGGKSVNRFDVEDADSFELFLRRPATGIAFVMGLEDSLSNVAARLNAARDELADRRAVIWLPVDSYAELARSAPDLVSISAASLGEPGFVGGAATTHELEPELAALETRFGMETAAFLSALAAGQPTGVPEEEAHRWTSLARAIGTR